MTDADDVLDAARLRAAALASGDGEALSALLHPTFTWATHVGQRLDRTAYVGCNTDGTTRWRGQELVGPQVVVVGDTAVLTATVVDTVAGAVGDEVFRMPVTLTWVRDAERGWRCLAGHAGPRIG